MVPVLIVAFYFPPHGGSGVQRASKLVKHLPSLGYRPVVVTTGVATRTSSAPIADPSLEAEIGPHCTVVRTPDDGSESGVRERVRAVTRFRRDHDGWARSARPVVRQAIREYRPEAVLITVSPFAAAALGDIATAEGVPWVLDLRDPWALDGWRAFPTRLHTRWDLRAMTAALRSADRVVANTPASRKEFLRLTGRPANEIVTIPNGFDEDDFASEAPPLQDGRFRVVHAGWLHDPSPPRGRSRSTLRTVGRQARSGRYLLEAVALLLARRPELAATIEIEFVGRVHPGHREIIARLGIEKVIVERDYVPHAQSVALVRSANMVFVPLHTVPDGEEALIVPGKLYEALASGRPLLACLPPGDAARLVEMTGGGVVCAADNAPKIAKTLESSVDVWLAGASSAGAPPGALAAFTRRRVAERFAAVFDDVRGVGPAVPADDPWAETERTMESLKGTHLHGER